MTSIEEKSISFPFSYNTNIEIRESEIEKIYKYTIYDFVEYYGTFDDGTIRMAITDKLYKNRCFLNKMLYSINWHTHPMLGTIIPSPDDLLNFITADEILSVVFSHVGIFVFNKKKKRIWTDKSKILEYLKSLSYIIIHKIAFYMHKQLKTTHNTDGVCIDFSVVDDFEPTFIDFTEIVNCIETEYIQEIRYLFDILNAEESDFKINFIKYPFDINRITKHYFIEYIASYNTRKILREEAGSLCSFLYFKHTKASSLITNMLWHYEEFKSLKPEDLLETSTVKPFLCVYLTPKNVKSYIYSLSPTQLENTFLAKAKLNLSKVSIDVNGNVLQNKTYDMLVLATNILIERSPENDTQYINLKNIDVNHFYSRVLSYTNKVMTSYTRFYYICKNFVFDADLKSLEKCEISIYDEPEPFEWDYFDPMILVDLKIRQYENLKNAIKFTWINNKNLNELLQKELVFKDNFEIDDYLHLYTNAISELYIAFLKTRHPFSIKLNSPVFLYMRNFAHIWD